MSPSQTTDEKTFSDYLGQFVGDDIEWTEYVVRVCHRGGSGVIARFRYLGDAIRRCDELRRNTRDDDATVIQVSESVHPENKKLIAELQDLSMDSWYGVPYYMALPTKAAYDKNLQWQGWDYNWRILNGKETRLK